LVPVHWIYSYWLYCFPLPLSSISAWNCTLWTILTQIPFSSFPSSLSSCLLHAAAFPLMTCTFHFLYLLYEYLQ
jgi:hypothetical protein